MDQEHVSRPCNHCGTCCKVGPCQFGTYDHNLHKCAHLTDDNLCELYAEIESYPDSTFGEGCESEFRQPGKWTDFLQWARGQLRENQKRRGCGEMRTEKEERRA